MSTTWEPLSWNNNPVHHRLLLPPWLLLLPMTRRPSLAAASPCVASTRPLSNVTQLLPAMGVRKIARVAGATTAVMKVDSTSGVIQTHHHHQLPRILQLISLRMFKLLRRPTPPFLPRILQLINLRIFKLLHRQAPPFLLRHLQPTNLLTPPVVSVSKILPSLVGPMQTAQKFQAEDLVLKATSRLARLVLPMGIVVRQMESLLIVECVKSGRRLASVILTCALLRNRPLLCRRMLRPTRLHPNQQICLHLNQRHHFRHRLPRPILHQFRLHPRHQLL
jgi:hypothetical protein